MIESVNRTGAPVVNSGYGGAKEFGKSTVSKSQVVNDVFSENSAVSAGKHSIQKPSANTHENQNVSVSQDTNLKELLGQAQHNYDKGSETYMAESELLKQITETMERLNTSDNALLGVDKLIEDIKTSTQFGLEDIRNVERNMQYNNMHLEIGLYSLIRVLEEGYKALRGQLNTESDSAVHVTEYAKEKTVGGAAQAGAAEETAEANKHSVAARMAEYFAKLDEANSGKQFGGEQEYSGIMAGMKTHIAKIKELREEKIFEERKKQRQQLYYPKEDTKKQRRNVSINDTEDINKSIQLQKHKAANVLNIYQKAIEATAKEMVVTGLGQLVLA